MIGLLFNAVRGAFGKEIDYGVLVKKYGSDANPRPPWTRELSPPAG